MKYQQGGVSNVPNFPAPNVGGIPNSPEFQWPTMPGIDIPAMANMAQDRYTRQRQIEADQLKQQAALEGDQKDFGKLRDSIFGEVDNPSQLQRLQGVRTKYSIPDNLDQMNMNNSIQLKSETDKLYKASKSKEVYDVYGEVGQAELFLKMTPPTDPAGLAEYKQAVEDYHNYNSTDVPFDINRLNPNLYKAAKTVSNQKFVAQTMTAAKGFGHAIDWNNSDDANRFVKSTAMDWFVTDPQGAVTAGLLVTDADGNPTPNPTPQGIEFAQTHGQLASDAYYGSIKDKKDMIDYRDQKTDENRAQTQAHADAVRAAKENGKTAGGHKSTVGGVFMSDAVRENLKTKGYTDEMIDDPAVRAEFGNVLDEKGNYVGSTASHDVAAEAGKVAWNKQTKSHGDYINKADDLGYDVTQYPVQKAIQDAVDQGASLDELDGLIKAAIKKNPIVPKTQSSTNLLPTDNTSNPPATQVAPVAPPAAGTFGEFKKQN